MNPRRRWNRRGLSLVEMLVVMALIGLTSSIASVYVSSSDADMRNTVRELRYDLELAKREAVARNTSIFIAHSYMYYDIDCNGDGAVDQKDHCYILYEDRNGDRMYTPNLQPPEEIKLVEIDPEMEIYSDRGAMEPWFTPYGESRDDHLVVRSTVPVESDCCPSQCMAIYYDMSISHVGRIDVGEKDAACMAAEEPTCIDCSFCGTCSQTDT